MENCAVRSTGGELEEAIMAIARKLEEAIMSIASTSATPVETSSFHTALEECLPSSTSATPVETSSVRTALEECLPSSTSATPVETSSFRTALEECLPSLDEVRLGGRKGAGSSMDQKSEYFSARVEEMMRSKSQFSSDVEHEIEHSRVHWSELSGLSDSSEDDNDHEEVNEENEEVNEEVKRENEEVFTELMNNDDYGAFFVRCSPHWKLGRKIAEGGQAEIFEVINNDGIVFPMLLLKVFKRGSRLSDLRKQWPCGILLREVLVCIVILGTILDDGRFAFALYRFWGDLRKLIDRAMKEKKNQGPPFPYQWNGEWNGGIVHAKDIITGIAYRMNWLHKKGIVHRDLKAANILLSPSDEDEDEDLLIYIGDYECSIGVVGTKFWRAPEILLGMKNGSVIDFSEKVDIYGYGMTCFEIVTGRLPFEGELEVCRASYDLVIEGRRPTLPSDLDVTLKDLIERCWSPIPNERPSFSEIIDILDP